MTASPPPFEAFDLPEPWPESLLPRIRQHNTPSAAPIVVLDDDPLGGQCVHDTPVLTTWNPDDLAAEIERSKVFLLLTNTRSLGRDEAIERSRDVAASLWQAARDSAVLPVPIWRSDSTLRGHFWWEMKAFAAEYLEGPSKPVFVFVPYFGDGGRYTLHDTQFVLQDGMLLPVADTEFARDPMFAYTHSHVPSWLEAHTEGLVRADEVLAIGHGDLRFGGPDRVASLLVGAPKGSTVIVNATTDRDLEVFIAGLQSAEETGGYFLCSGTASFVRVRAGQEIRPLLGVDELRLTGDIGGLTIVGSYVDRTRSQLDSALALPGVGGVELDIGALRDSAGRDEAIARAAGAVARRLASGEDVVLHTNSGFVEGMAPLLGGAFRAIVETLSVRPRYLLVKGGTTASDLATTSLGAHRALVLGQLLPGVPVWRLGAESRWPRLPLIIFPGNVGSPESLTEALVRLRGSK